MSTDVENVLLIAVKELRSLKFESFSHEESIRHIAIENLVEIIGYLHANGVLKR